MGWDLHAYVDVDQEKMDQLIQKYQFDKRDKRDKRIAGTYEALYLPKLPETGFYKWLFYHYDDDCQIHELYYSIPINFIRDDKRFSNSRYLRLLGQKHGENFPQVLQGMDSTINTDADARKVAEALDKFFPEEKTLSTLAKWLRATSRVCSIYETNRTRGNEW